MKKKKKRRISLLLAAAALVLAFAGCTQSGSGSTSNPTKVDALESGKKYTVQFWHELSGSNLDYLNTVIKAFNDTHPNIQVVATYQGSYDDGYTKLQQAIASGTVPDIDMVERAYVQYFANNNALVDLNPYFKNSKVSTDIFVKGLTGHSYFDNHFNAIPFNRSTPIMYVNKTLLDSKGLAVPKTWDELKTVTNALVEKNGDQVTRYGMTMPFDTWYPMAMVMQAGGKFLNDKGSSVGYTDAVGNKVFGFLKNLQNTNALYYPPTQGSGTTANQMFTSGKVGILWTSTGSYGGLKKAVNGAFQIQTAFLPKEQKYATPTGGANIVVPAKSANKAAAWEFIKWMLTDSKGLQQFVALSGYLPTTTTMVKSQQFQDLWKQDANYKVAYDQLQYAMDTNKTVVWPDINKEDEAAIQAIMYNNASIPDTLTKLRKQIEQSLQQ